MFEIANTALGAVVVQCFPTFVLRKRGLRPYVCRCGFKEGVHRRIIRAHDVPLIERIAHARAVDGCARTVNQTSTIEFTQNTHHTASAVDVFHMVFLRGRRDFGEIRHFTAEAVNIADGEVHACFLRRCKQMQHRVG